MNSCLVYSCVILSVFTYVFFDHPLLLLPFILLDNLFRFLSRFRDIVTLPGSDPVPSFLNLLRLLHRPRLFRQQLPSLMDA